jgi:hypothetical protein
LADHSTISRLSVKVRKARARDVGDCMTHSPVRRKEKAKRGEGEGGGGCFMSSRLYFWCAGGLALMEWQL